MPFKPCKECFTKMAETFCQHQGLDPSSNAPHICLAMLFAVKAIDNGDLVRDPDGWHFLEVEAGTQRKRICRADVPR